MLLFVQFFKNMLCASAYTTIFDAEGPTLLSFVTLFFSQQPRLRRSRAEVGGHADSFVAEARHIHLKVQVRPGTPAGIAAVTNQLALGYCIALIHYNTSKFEVRIIGNAPVFVEDEQKVAIIAAGFGGATPVGIRPHFDDHASAGRMYGRSHRHHKVKGLFAAMAEIAIVALPDGKGRTLFIRQLINKILLVAGIYCIAHVVVVIVAIAPASIGFWF